MRIVFQESNPQVLHLHLYCLSVCVLGVCINERSA